METLVFLCWGVCVAAVGAGGLSVVGETLWREDYLTHPEHRLTPGKVLVGVMIIFPNPHTPIKSILQMRNVWLRD